MRVLIEPSTFDCLNLGDVAMLRDAVALLRDTWPGIRLSVLTSDPDALAMQCPGCDPVSEVGRRAWVAEDALAGSLVDRLPLGAGRHLAALGRSARRRIPGLFTLGLRGRLRARGGAGGPVGEFWRAFRDADLVVVSGAATLNDLAVTQAEQQLRMLDHARQRGVPFVLLGQGLGPLADPGLLALAARVLPAAALLGLRERAASLPLARRLGVPEDRIVLTGDAALSAAYAARPAALGDGIGVAVRVGRATGVTFDELQPLGAMLRRAAAGLGRPLVPVPIARHQAADAWVLSRLLGPADGPDAEGGARIENPEHAVAQVARCRVVVTLAYHAAVFAAAQGIPVVCLWANQYYRDKFRGLAELMRAGCEVLPLPRGADGTVAEAIARSLREADAVRPGMLAAVVAQIGSRAELGRRLHAVAPGAAIPQRAPAAAPVAVGEIP